MYVSTVCMYFWQSICVLNVLHSDCLKRWERLSLTPPPRTRRWGRSSWRPCTSPGECLHLKLTPGSRSSASKPNKLWCGVFRDDGSFIPRLPLSVVECSQFLGICALPGKDVSASWRCSFILINWTENIENTLSVCHLGCRYKDTQRSLERDIRKLPLVDTQLEGLLRQKHFSNVSVWFRLSHCERLWEHVS